MNARLARIAIDPEVCGGKPCIKGTRIWVSLILDNLSDGMSEIELLAEYPQLTHDDVLAAMTGFWDWLRSTEKGTQARRTANTHALTMITVTLLAVIDTALRLNVYNTRTHPNVAILVISLVAAALVSIGAAFGGTLVYDYGFNVETAGDSPVWHTSEVDVLPGDHTT